jgi:RNA polymerase sigma factor (TIGR02999 family)
MHEPSDGSFTRLLQLAQQGDESAENQLFELIDDELRRIAARISRGRNEVRATSLVNDAYVYLFERIKIKQDLDLQNRSYFFRAVADRMRNILLDRAKKRRPGPWNPALDECLQEFNNATSWDYQTLHELLTEFTQSDDPKKRRRHQLINLHFFGGMTYKAAAAELGISVSQYQLDRDRDLAELQQEIAARLS